MSVLMRCQYCGLLQDEPSGVKECQRCGGELAYEQQKPVSLGGSYIQVQMELDQVNGPAGRMFDRYLLVTLRTPEEVPAEHAAPTESGRPPLGFTAVLDVSGSMSGQKLFNAKEAVRQALHRMHEGDALSLVIFANDVRCVLEPSEFNKKTAKVVESALDEIHAGGMTALCGGLELGIEKARLAARSTNLILLLSDGQANVGETDIEKVGLHSFQARQTGLLVSTLGVGEDYNEALMVEIATQGGGRFYHVLYADQISASLTGELGEAARLAAHQASIELDLPAGAMVMPLSPAYPVSQQDGKVRIDLGSIPSDLELEVPLRLTLPAQPPDTKLSVEGRFSYISPAGKTLGSLLNRVMVRFVDAQKFKIRDGVVAPVVEHVLTQMKAAQVLEVARVRYRAPAEAAERGRQGANAVREYASLLGDERADAELRDSLGTYDAMAASPAQAKASTASAFAAMRAPKRPKNESG